MMKVLIGADHAGFELKEKVKKEFASEFEWKDFGTFSIESMDYPDVAHPLAEEISEGKTEFGILLCGSGNGMAITANKHENVRAALCWCEQIAELARKHNNANILVLPARFVSDEEAFSMIKRFFHTAFEGGRHNKRVEKINLD